MTMRLASAIEHSYEVALAPDLTQVSDDAVPSLAMRRALLVATPTVDRLYGSRVQAWLKAAEVDVDYVVVALSEESKTISAVHDICAHAVRRGLGRRDALVALGGGVCSDVVGFAASMIRRGIRHVRIPTTLVGQIDAGIGIKGGVNFQNRKNYLGCFYPPSAVYVDPVLLRTLEQDHILQGLAEIVKIALVADPALFRSIAEHGSRLVDSKFQAPRAESLEIVRRSIQLMLEQLQTNPFENQSLKRLVDMGHTFSPTLEEESGFTIAHGEAVSIDMALTCALAILLELMSVAEAEQVVRLLRDLGLPIWSSLLSVSLCKTAIDHAKSHRGGRLNLVMPTKIGSAHFLETSEALTDSVLEQGIGRLHDISIEAGAATRPSFSSYCEAQ